MVSAIIVAGGRGERMQDPLRKQYIQISGRPVLSHTLSVFDACAAVDRIVLVVPEGEEDYCKKAVITPLHPEKEIRLTTGGKERCDSVFNGLKAVENDTRLVVIHDGVRPYIHSNHIEACVRGAEQSGACILAVCVTDTVKCVDGSMTIEKTLNRENLQLAQTPQAFQYDLIMKAHIQAKKEGVVGNDDAELVERLGEKVRVVPGSRLNIKITEKEDLTFVACLLKGFS